MFAVVGRPKILEQSDSPPECSVSARQCQPVPGHLAGVDLGPTGCKWALEPRSSSQPLPTLGLPAWTCSFPRLSCSCVFYSFFNLLLQDEFCGEWQWDWALGRSAFSHPSPPLQPPQAPQWAELGSLTEASMAPTVRRQREGVPEEGYPEKLGTWWWWGYPMGQGGVGAEGQTAVGTRK